MNKNYFIYILECSDNSYYIWVTNDIEKRLDEHSRSEDITSYVYLRKPFKLVFQEEYYDIKDALLREKQIKRWTRKKKIALIEQNFNLLQDLSKSNK